MTVHVQEVSDERYPKLARHAKKLPRPSQAHGLPISETLTDIDSFLESEASIGVRFPVSKLAAFGRG